VGAWALTKWELCEGACEVQITKRARPLPNEVPGPLRKYPNPFINLRNLLLTAGV
jgi:hypothetical protein